MGQRGPAKKPAAQKKRAGTFRRDRDGGIELPAGCPACPDWLHEYAQDQWRTLAPQLVERGMLAQVDQMSFALLCQAWADWRKAVEELARDELVITSDKGNTYQNPLVGIRNKSWLNVLRGCQQFGLTASARTGIKVPDAPRELSEEEKRILGG